MRCASSARQHRRNTLRRAILVEHRGHIRPTGAIKLTDVDLATAATACRATAYQEGQRPKKNVGVNNSAPSATK